MAMAAAVAWMNLGCSGQDDGRIPVYPTSGRVTVDGQPAAGAIVTFYGDEDRLRGPGLPVPMATTQEDGTFQVSSFGNQDGAPAGKFNVTVTWPEPLPPGADEEFYQPADRLQGRYADPKTSGLSVEVPEGGGELPVLELKSSGPGA